MKSNVCVEPGCKDPGRYQDPETDGKLCGAHFRARGHHRPVASLSPAEPAAPPRDRPVASSVEDVQSGTAGGAGTAAAGGTPALQARQKVAHVASTSGGETVADVLVRELTTSNDPDPVGPVKIRVAQENPSKSGPKPTRYLVAKDADARTASGACRIAGCARRGRKRGLCSPHYVHAMRNDYLDVVGAPVRSAPNVRLKAREPVVEDFLPPRVALPSPPTGELVLPAWLASRVRGLCSDPEGASDEALVCVVASLVGAAEGERASLNEAELLRRAEAIRARRRVLAQTAWDLAALDLLARGVSEKWLHEVAVDDRIAVVSGSSDPCLGTVTVVYADGRVSYTDEDGNSRSVSMKHVRKVTPFSVSERSS